MAGQVDPIWNIQFRSGLVPPSEILRDWKPFCVQTTSLIPRLRNISCEQSLSELQSSLSSPQWKLFSISSSGLEYFFYVLK